MNRVILGAPPRTSRTGRVYVKKKEGAGNNPPPPPLPFRGGEGRGVLPSGASGLGDKIMGQLESLTATEQRNILARLALLQQSKGDDKSRDLDMWSGAVYEALVAANGGGAGGVPGQALVRRVLGAASTWDHVTGFMDASKLEDLSVTERQAMYRLLAKMLVGHARFVSRKSGAPLSPKLVASCSGALASLFDQSFPGYLRMGLAKVVARALTQPQSENHHADCQD